MIPRQTTRSYINPVAAEFTIATRWTKSILSRYVTFLIQPVCRSCSFGSFHHVLERVAQGVKILAPLLDPNELAVAPVSLADVVSAAAVGPLGWTVKQID